MRTPVIMRVPLILILIVSICSSCTKTSKDAVNYYTENKIQLLEVEKYFGIIKPKDFNVSLRFNSDDNVSLIISQKDYWKKETWIKKNLFDEYGVIDISQKQIKDSIVQNALPIIGWSSNTLDSLYVKLRRVNSDYITYKNLITNNSLVNKSYTSIGFPTNEMYSLDYYFLDTCLTIVELKKVKEDCSYEVIDNCTLIKYTGTSWMSDCMPEKRN